MAPDFPMMIQAALVVAGVVWLKTAIRYLPEEIQAFKTTEQFEERLGQLVAWVISGIILGVTSWFVLKLVMTFVAGISI